MIYIYLDKGLGKKGYRCSPPEMNYTYIDQNSKFCKDKRGFSQRRVSLYFNFSTKK